MKRKQTPEGQLQRLVLDWLAAKHILAFRMNSGTLRDTTGRPVTFGVPGMADILAFPMMPIVGPIKPTWVPCPSWLELKATTGKQSDLQKSFQALVESHGHRYIVARSVEDVIDALR